MNPSLTDIPRVSSETRGKRLLRTCFEELVRARKLGANPSDRLKAKDWERVSGFDLNRVVRRIAISCMGTFGILTKTGYRAAFAHGRQQRMFANEFTGLKYRTHVMRHPGWPLATVLIAESHESERHGGHSIGIWAFLPNDDEFLDALDLRDHFNGAGPSFMTPAGNFNEVAHSWSWDSNGAHGRRSEGGRDWSSLELRVHRFQGQLLPLLRIPQNCRLYSVTRHARYY